MDYSHRLAYCNLRGENAEDEARNGSKASVEVQRENIIALK
jgi:hypothetical protein